MSISATKLLRSIKKNGPRVFPGLTEYMLNKDVVFTTISEVLHNPSITKKLKSERIFARPDSPLKEFSGRIIPSENLSSDRFDYGFSHENLNLPIILAPFKPIEKEYRFVCVNKQIITGCEYEEEGHKGGRTILSEDKEPAFLFAQTIADKCMIREFAYIIDVCKSENSFYLVEINPFSGADLYNCDAKIIIEAIEEYVKNEKDLQSYYDSFNVKDVWHEDNRLEDLILSRLHGDYTAYIFFKDGIYSVRIYLDYGTV